MRRDHRTNSNGGCRCLANVVSASDCSASNHSMYVCIFMALVSTLVLCARSQDSLLSVSERRVHTVFSAVGFKGEGKPFAKTRESNTVERHPEILTLVRGAPRHQKIPLKKSVFHSINKSDAFRYL